MRSNGPSPASPLAAVGLAHEGIGDAERLEALPRLLGQRPVALDGDHPGRQPRHDRRREARARADLQHAVARLELAAPR